MQPYQFLSFRVFAEMHLGNARQTKIDDSFEGENPSTSGAQLTEASLSDLSNAKVSKVVPYIYHKYIHRCNTLLCLSNCLNNLLAAFW